MLLQTRNAEEYFAQKNEFTTGPVELEKRIKDGENLVIVDVRERADFDKGHIPNAVSLPEKEWPTLVGLCTDVPNVFYCYSQTCHLASKAGQFFSRQGYRAVEMQGGFEAWQAADLEVEE